MEINTDFTLVEANTFQSQFWGVAHRPGFITKDRPVRYYEIELYSENAKSTFINGIEYPICKNHILVAKPGQTRHSILDFSCLYIYIDTKSEGIRHLLDSLPATFEVSNIFQYTALFQALIDAKIGISEYTELMISSKIYELIYRMASDASGVPCHANHVQLEKARIFIEENFTKPIQLKDIAAVTNFSPAYCHKQFKKHYKQTPGEYLLQLRLHAAKKMLLMSESSMEEIALACGFSSHAYFNAVFKQHTGLPPLKFKNHSISNYKL